MYLQCSFAVFCLCMLAHIVYSLGPCIPHTAILPFASHTSQTLCRYMSDRFSRRVLLTLYNTGHFEERDGAILHFDSLVCLIGLLNH